MVYRYHVTCMYMYDKMMSCDTHDIMWHTCMTKYHPTPMYDYDILWQSSMTKWYHVLRKDYKISWDTHLGQIRSWHTYDKMIAWHMCDKRSRDTHVWQNDITRHPCKTNSERLVRPTRNVLHQDEQIANEEMWCNDLHVPSLYSKQFSALWRKNL